MKNKWFRLIALIVVVSIVGTAVAYVGATGVFHPNVSPEDGNSAHRFRRSLLPTIVSSGIVEAVDGEVNVAAQIPGQIAELKVREGDRIAKGDVIAVIEGARQSTALQVAEKNLLVAQAKLEQLITGNGKEEIEEARQAMLSTAAELKYQKTSWARIQRMHAKKAAALDELDRKTQNVELFERRLQSLKKRYEALKRGPLQEEIDVARSLLKLAQSKVNQAQVEFDYRTIRAPMDGTILHVYAHAGDIVALEPFLPIVRMANPDDLRIRLEIDETNATRIHDQMEGPFEIRGVAGTTGQLKIEKVIPAFGPKRLFNPDTSARLDSRTLAVFCEILESRIDLFLGQRVTARFEIERQTASWCSDAQ